MTKQLSNISKTLFGFFNQIAPTYLENSVPETLTNPITGKEEPVKMPYITFNYSYVLGLDDTMIQGRIWTNSTSRTPVNTLNGELIDLIGRGTVVPIENEEGTLYIRTGNPISEPYITEDTNISANYFTLTMNILL